MDWILNKSNFVSTDKKGGRTLHWIVVVGALVALGFSGLYLFATLKGSVKPNKVTWLIWAVAPLISAFASFSAGVSWATLPVFASGLGPLLIFFASFFNPSAYWKVTVFDLLCGGCSILALIAWALTQDANVAIFLSLSADALAALPTLVKGWRFPETENGWLYLGSALSAAASFTEIKAWSFVEIAFPLYLIGLGLSFCLLFETRKFQVAKKAS